MRNEDICWMGATDLTKAIKTKKLPPVGVIRTFLRRIKSVNPKINVYVTVTFEEVSPWA